MTSRPVRRTTAVVAIGATALGAAALAGVTAVASSPAAAATRTHTSLDVRLIKPAIVPGGTDHIGGVLLAGGKAASGRAVELRARAPKSKGFATVQTGTTNGNGRVAFTVSPAATTHYRLVFRGDTGDRRSGSGVVTVRVVPAHHGNGKIPTSVSIRVAHHRVAANGRDRVAGRLTSRGSRLVGKQVVLQDKLAGATTWTDLATHRSGRHGRVDFVVTPAATTRYRLRFVGTTNFRASHSGVRRVVVNETALTINAASTAVDPGDADTVSGVLTDSGSPVDGATVQLRSRPAGQQGAFTEQATGTSGTDGSVSFPVTVSASTTYVLVVAKTDTLPAARSAALTVHVRGSSSLSIRGRQDAKSFVVSGILLGGGHPLRGRTVQLLRRPAGTTDAFVVVAHQRTGKNGQIVFHRKPGASVDFELRFLGGSKFQSSSSGVVTDTAP